MATYAYLALCGVIASAIAADTYSDYDMKHKAEWVAKSGVPMWNFASGSCYAQPAEDGNGNLVPNSTVRNKIEAMKYPLCGSGLLDILCEPKLQWMGYNTEGPDAPTYWGMQYCDADQSYRVFYDLFMPVDVHHAYDWEWAIIVYKQDEHDRWFREQILMEVHGNTEKAWWEDITTFAGDDDKLSDDGRGLNFPKMYLGKGGHDVHMDKQKKNKNLPCSEPSYRMNEWYLWKPESLRSWTVMNSAWNWGSADSDPRALAGYAAPEKWICNKETLVKRRGGYKGEQDVIFGL